MHLACPLAKLHAIFVRAHPCPGPWGHVLSPPRGGRTTGQHQALHPHLHPSWLHRWVLGCPTWAPCPQQGSGPVGMAVLGGPWGWCGAVQGWGVGWGGLHASPAGWAGQGAHFEAVMGAAPRPPAVPLPSPGETPPLPQEADGAQGGWGGWGGAMWALLLRRGCPAGPLFFPCPEHPAMRSRPGPQQPHVAQA